jgi:hypothetical protein
MVFPRVGSTGDGDRFSCLRTLWLPVRAPQGDGRFWRRFVVEKDVAARKVRNFQLLVIRNRPKSCCSCTGNNHRAFRALFCRPQMFARLNPIF